MSFFGNATPLDINDRTLLHLQETYSLSVLMYAIPVLLLILLDKWVNWMLIGIMSYVECLVITN